MIPLSRLISLSNCDDKCPFESGTYSDVTAVPVTCSALWWISSIFGFSLSWSALPEPREFISFLLRALVIPESSDEGEISLKTNAGSFIGEEVLISSLINKWCSIFFFSLQDSVSLRTSLIRSSRISVTTMFKSSGITVSSSCSRIICKGMGETTRLGEYVGVLSDPELFCRLSDSAVSGSR